MDRSKNNNLISFYELARVDQGEWYRGEFETSSSCGHRGARRSAGKTPTLTLEEMQRRPPMVRETRWFANRRDRRGGRGSREGGGGSL